MNKISLLLLVAAGFIFISFSSVHSQSVVFCEDVDGDFNPIGEDVEFSIPSDGGWVKALVNTKKEIGCDYVYFDIYRTNKGEEKLFINSVSLETGTDWTKFWQKLWFFSPGTYTVEVHDCNAKLITKNKIGIIFRK